MDEECQDGDLKQKLCRLWGGKVRDLLIENEGVLGKVWEWKDWGVEGLSQRQQQCLKDIFTRRRVYIIVRRDKIS